MSAGGNRDEPAFIFLLLIVALAIVGWLVWRLSGTFWLSYPLRWLRYAELFPINLINHRYDACLDWLRYAQVNEAIQPPAVATYTRACFGGAYLASLSPEDYRAHFHLSGTAIKALGAEAMLYWRWPIAAVLGGISGWLLLFSPVRKFATRHTLETLIQVQSKMWPIISPIVKYNPSKSGRILGDPIPDNIPIFGEALSPEEWISWNRIPVINGIPDKDATRRAFIRQLGPRWKGMDGLPVYIRALLAAFSLKGAQRREQADDLLGRLALCWSPEKGFNPSSEIIGEVDTILADPEAGGKSKVIAENFAWRTTAIVGVLKWARNNGGVLAPAQFLWLRAVDRELWYPLNNLGRRAFHSEGAGAMAHFMAEEGAKKPLPIPRIDTAIVTLNTYLHDPDKRTVQIPPREGDEKMRS